jgi:hypothetical protein
LRAREVGIHPDIWYGRQDIGKPPPLRSAQRFLQNLPVRFLGANTSRSRPFFQGVHELHIQVPNQQLHDDHLRTETSCDKYCHTLTRFASLAGKWTPQLMFSGKSTFSR